MALDFYNAARNIAFSLSYFDIFQNYMYRNLSLVGPRRGPFELRFKEVSPMSIKLLVITVTC